MTLAVSYAFRVLLWILLTSDLSGPNLAIGLAVALLLPQAHHRSQALLPALRALVGSLVAIPLAYGEAIALIAGRGREQERWIERSASGSQSPLVIFLEVLAITLTPFTIVLGVTTGAAGPRYRIHELRPQRHSPAIPSSVDSLR